MYFENFLRLYLFPQIPSGRMLKQYIRKPHTCVPQKVVSLPEQLYIYLQNRCYLLQFLMLLIISKFDIKLVRQKLNKQLPQFANNFGGNLILVARSFSHIVVRAVPKNLPPMRSMCASHIALFPSERVHPSQKLAECVRAGEASAVS